MDGPRDYHTRWSKSERERQISDIAYMWNGGKMIQMNLFTKQTESHRLQNKFMITKGEPGEG